MFSKRVQCMRLLNAVPYSTVAAFRRHVYRGQLNQAITMYNELPSEPLNGKLLKQLILLARNSKFKNDLYFLKQLIHDMPIKFKQNPSPFEYNALIYAYGAHNQSEKAHAVFKKMKQLNVQPNIFTYNTILNIFKKERQIEQAEALFKEIPEPDTVTYNTMLQLWHQSGNRNRVFEFYNSRQFQSHADIRTLSIILDAALTENQEIAQSVFDILVDSRNIDTTAMNIMLKYKRNNLRETLDFFSQFKQKCIPDRTTFNILLDICFQHEDKINALKIYQEMKKMQIDPDIVTYGTFIDAEKHMGTLVSAMDLFEEMQMTIRPNRRIVSALVNMAIQATDEAQLDRLVAITLPYQNHIDLVAYNMLMGGLAKYGRSKQVQEIYNRAFRHEKPDIVTFTNLILAYSNDNCVQDALEIYKVLRKSQHKEDQAKVKLDVTFYTTLIASLSKFKNDSNERLLAALTLFSDMRNMGIQPSAQTYTAMLHACGQYRDGYVLEHVYGLIKVDLSLDPDIGIYNALMDAYNRTSDGQAVLEIWEQLTMSSDVVIDQTSVSIVFDSCGHNGYFDRARLIWKRLKRNQFDLNTNNYTSYIECLCRIPGQEGFDEAVKIAESMSRPGHIKPNQPTLSTKTINTLHSFARKKGIQQNLLF